MIVHYMATYYSQWAHDNLAPRSQDQWYSFKFCRAVKNRRINGSLVFPWQNGPETINEQSVGRARAIFGLFIEHAIRHCGLANPVLVPVPSKDGLIGAAQFRSLAMAQEAVAAVPNQHLPIASSLRFNQVLQPAHAGGPRGREALRPYLNLTTAIPAGPVILIDDIVTTGGSLLASHDVLSAAGHPPVAAIVCGHTVSDSLLSAFGHHQKNIDTAPQQIFF
jgi:hypothetical protein